MSNVGKFDVYQAITDQIISLLETGTAPWRKPWNYGTDGGPINLASKKHYQGINSFLLTCSPYSSPYWLTFKQALDLGGSVRKGEKGRIVIFWKIYEKENATGEKVNLPVLRYYHVFNAEQCEGLTLPESNQDTWANHNPIEAAERVALAMPNRPRVNYGGGRAFYRPSDDSVTVPELKRFDTAEEYYNTLFHELAHSTGHKSRLNREGVTGIHFFGDHEYSKEELVAEMTASFLCGATGIAHATIENSAAYLQSWVRVLRSDKKMVITAAAQAQKAADYILNKQQAA